MSAEESSIDLFDLFLGADFFDDFLAAFFGALFSGAAFLDALFFGAAFFLVAMNKFFKELIKINVLKTRATHSNIPLIDIYNSDKDKSINEMVAIMYMRNSMLSVRSNPRYSPFAVSFSERQVTYAANTLT
ncbi:hypothetical protein [Flavitalea sp.]|nr:hypothetical protein [Flavitalea sp.]